MKDLNSGLKLSYLACPQLPQITRVYPTQQSVRPSRHHHDTHKPSLSYREPESKLAPSTEHFQTSIYHPPQPSHPAIPPTLYPPYPLQHYRTFRRPPRIATMRLDVKVRFSKLEMQSIELFDALPS